MITAELFGYVPTLLRHSGLLVLRVVLAWLRWFWRLRVGGKMAVTAVEVVALYVVTNRMPLASRDHQAVVQFGAVALCILLFAALLSWTRFP
jgi:hypothetical protein